MIIRKTHLTKYSSHMFMLEKRNVMMLAFKINFIFIQNVTIWDTNHIVEISNDTFWDKSHDGYDQDYVRGIPLYIQ